MDLAKSWSSVVLPIDHHYYEYMQVHQQIGDRKIVFGKWHRSGNCCPAFGRQSIINKFKKDNEADKRGTEAAAASTLIPLDSSLWNARSSTTRTCSSTGNTKQFERICFVCNEIPSCNSNAYNEGGLGLGEFKSAGDRLMDAANAIGETNDLHAAKHWLTIFISGESKDIYSAEIKYHRSCYSRFIYRKREDTDVIKQKSYGELLNDFKKKLRLSIVYRSNPYLLNELLQD